MALTSAADCATFRGKIDLNLGTEGRLIPTVGSALVEEAIILVGAALLWSHAGFRRTISATPRALRWVVGAGLGVWFVSQIAEIDNATYPFMSWNMYGESLHDAPIEGFRLHGVDCDGKEHSVPWSGGALGRRPRLAFAIPRAYHAEHVAARSTPWATAANTDSLLHIVFRAWNDEPGHSPLCELQLQRVEVAAAMASRAPLPPYETVRTVTGR